ncbi:MAG: M42 family metallopeptidase [Akkermansiaceae bacterium]|nr:M42 family metallopeptidase [Akkermansiaceae bacterium]
MKEAAISLLQELTETHAVPAHEEEVREVFLRELDGLGSFSTDRLGSVFCEGAGEGPRVLLAGHMDEIGFLVQNISAEGFIQLVPVGGWWTHSLLSQRLQIKTSSGRKILGVVASTPPHLLPESQRQQVLAIEQLFLDLGADSHQQVIEEFGVRVGDPVAPVSGFTELERKGRFLAKAFDNRVGMAAAIQAGKAVLGEDLPNRLIVGGTSQEEVGLRGGKTAAAHVKPDVAIVLEGPPADDGPGLPRGACQGRLGGGAQIRMFDPTAIANPGLARFAIEVAEQEGIAHQVTVRRSGGTDAGSIHLANEGIPSVVIGVPARYIHSHNAIMDIHDQICAVRLVQAMVMRLDEATVRGFTNYI